MDYLDLNKSTWFCRNGEIGMFFSLPGDLGQDAAIGERIFTGMQSGDCDIVTGDEADMSFVFAVGGSNDFP